MVEGKSQVMLTNNRAIIKEKNIEEEREAVVENRFADTIARLILDSTTNALI